MTGDLVNFWAPDYFIPCKLLINILSIDLLFISCLCKPSRIFLQVALFSYGCDVTAQQFVRTAASVANAYDSGFVGDRFIEVCKLLDLTDGEAALARGYREHYSSTVKPHGLVGVRQQMHLEALRRHTLRRYIHESSFDDSVVDYPTLLDLHAGVYCAKTYLNLIWPVWRCTDLRG